MSTQAAMATATGFGAGIVNALPRRSLRVVQGIHRGATIPLVHGSNIVGSAPDCDVLLSDVGIAAHHMELVVEGSTLWMRRIDDAAVTVQGRELTAQRAILGSGHVVQLGECAFKLMSSDAVFIEQRASVLNDTTPKRPGSLVGWVLLGFALFAAALWYLPTLGQQSMAGTIKHDADDSQTARFERAVASLNAKNLKIEKMGSTTYRMSGYVDTQDQARALTLITREVPQLQISSNVIVGSQVADWIRDSIASPQLVVNYVGGGKVTISGEVDGPAYQARLAQVHRQFARLVQIEDRTKPTAKQRVAVAASTPKPSLTLHAIPGSMSNGKATYMVSDGRQRYFAGAALSDGRVIESVRADRIVLRSPSGTREELIP